MLYQLSLFKGILFSIPFLACLYTSSDVLVFFFILLDHSLVGSFSAGFISGVFTKETGDSFCGRGMGVDVA